MNFGNGSARVPIISMKNVVLAEHSNRKKPEKNTQGKMWVMERTSRIDNE